MTYGPLILYSLQCVLHKITCRLHSSHANICIVYICEFTYIFDIIVAGIWFTFEVIKLEHFLKPYIAPPICVYDAVNFDKKMTATKPCKDYQYYMYLYVLANVSGSTILFALDLYDQRPLGSLIYDK